MFLFALLLAATVDSSRMAELIGNDRVTATYPGFHRTPGDATALAATGKDRPQADGFGIQDSIVVRKIANLSPQAAARFDLRSARELTLQHMAMPGYTTELERNVFASQQTSACGRASYGFAMMQRMRMHLFGGDTHNYAVVTAYALELVGDDVWQTTYSRGYEPGLEKHASALIAFAGNFCVQHADRKRNVTASR